MIMTSGTLSPLNSFVSALRVKVPITLENPHVIDKKQIWVGVVCNGPGGHQLSSAYANRSNANYQKDLGNTIVNFARIVPHGVLVFFPSYYAMKSCIQCWQDRSQTTDGRSIWDRIDNFKTPFVEPQNKAEFKQAMTDFYAKIDDPAVQGAIFFAVCRGKVSEGLDFADNNGRAVIITGMPFPPFKDTKVVLKREFLDQQRRKDGKGMTGQDWYAQQSSRAVNQAIGRVIRHRNDYGAIIFCDQRFSQPRNIAQLPSWLRPELNVYEKFGESQGKLTKFFKACSRDASLHHHAKAGPSGAVPALTAADYAAHNGATATGVDFSADTTVGEYSFAGVKRAQRKRRRVVIEVGSASGATVHIPADDSHDDAPAANLPPKPKKGALFSALSQHAPGDVHITTPAYDMGELAPATIQRAGSGDTLDGSGPAQDKRLNPFDPSWKVQNAEQASGTAVSKKPRKKSLYSSSKTLGEATIDKSKEDRGKQAIATYVDKVKRILEKDDFRRFTKLLKTYKKTEVGEPATAMTTMVQGFRILFVPLGAWVARFGLPFMECATYRQASHWTKGTHFPMPPLLHASFDMS